MDLGGVPYEIKGGNVLASSERLCFTLSNNGISRYKKREVVER
jgi:hypothetical protein